MTAPTAGNRYDLTNRVVVVTGGAGDLGQAVTTAFVAAGATVVVVERSEQSAAVDELAHRLGSAGQRVSGVVADVLNEASVASLVAEVLARHSRLDVLVNLVGGFAAGQAITELDVAIWERMQDLNVRSAFLASKHAAQPMIRQGWGRILNISSRGARSGRKHAGAYAVAKAAVITLTEVQAEELRDHGVTVNCILPSIIDTPTNRAGMPNADHSRWPRAEAVARILVFLASEDAGLINGAAIPVYGLA